MFNLSFRKRKFDVHSITRAMNRDCDPEGLRSLMASMKIEPGWHKALDQRKQLVFYVD